MNFNIRLLRLILLKVQYIIKKTRGEIVIIGSALESLNAQEESGEEMTALNRFLPSIPGVFPFFPLYKRTKDLGLMIVFILYTREHSKQVVDNLTVLIYKVGIFTVFTISFLFRGLL